MHVSARRYRVRQPDGHGGILFSLEQVAKMATEGREHGTVRSWVSHVLNRAGRPKGPLERARALYHALVTQCFWMPDPVDTEYMTGAHLLLGDGEHQAMFSAGDCDDLTIALAAAFLCGCESVGIRVAVVGHAYDDEQNISHVLTAIWIPKLEKWIYVDPSAADDLEFGQCDPWTREVIFTAPDAVQVCDADVCLNTGRKYEPVPASEGNFIGLSGRLSEGKEIVLDRPLGVPRPNKLSDGVEDALAGPFDSLITANAGELRALSGDLDAAYNQMLALQQNYAINAAQMESFGFTPNLFQALQVAKTAGLFCAQCCEDAVAGVRKISTTADGLDYMIESLPSDPFVLSTTASQGGAAAGALLGTTFVFLDRNTQQQLQPVLNTLGGPEVVPIGIFIVGAIAIVAMIGLYTSLAKQALQAAIVAVAEICKTIAIWRYTGLVQSGAATPEQAGALAGAIAKSESDFLGQAKKAATPAPDPDIDQLNNLLITVVVGAVVIGGGYLLWDAMKDKKAARRASSSSEETKKAAA